jgi:hypothetical protein
MVVARSRRHDSYDPENQVLQSFKRHKISTNDVSKSLAKLWSLNLKEIGREQGKNEAMQNRKHTQLLSMGDPCGMCPPLARVLCSVMEMVMCLLFIFVCYSNRLKS